MSRANPRFRRDQLPLPAPTNDTYMIRIFKSLRNQRIMTTYYFRGADVPTVAHYTDIESIITNDLVPQEQGVMAADVTWTDYSITLLTSPTVASKTGSLAGVGTGGIAGASRGTIDAATIVRLTAFKSKAGRGYVNLPIPSVLVDLTDNAKVSAAGIGGYQTYATNCFLTPRTVGAAAYTPCIVSRGVRLAPNVLGVADITDAFPQLLIGTVRRRKEGRGI